MHPDSRILDLYTRKQDKNTKEENIFLQWYGWWDIFINEGKRRVFVERFDWSVFLTSHAAASPLSADHSSPYTPRDLRNTLDTQRDTYQLRRSPPPEETQDEVSLLLTGRGCDTERFCCETASDRSVSLSTPALISSTKLFSVTKMS